MARLPSSLSIGLWLVGSIWLVGLLALWFDVAGEVVWTAFLAGLFVAVVEWLARSDA